MLGHVTTADLAVRLEVPQSTIEEMAEAAGFRVIEGPSGRHLRLRDAGRIVRELYPSDPRWDRRNP